MNDIIAAAIDVGTNSTKMTVAEIVDGVPKPLFDRSEVTRLGKGVDAAGKLNVEAIARTLDAIIRFADEARAAGASTILAAGTSALRDASNGRDLIDAARDRANVDIAVIEGQREAELAFATVCGDPEVVRGNGDVLVFDIGGGSTELIVGTRSGIDRRRSLDIGAVRLTERHIKTDPPLPSELDIVEQAARKAFNDYGRPEGHIDVVGIGGTAVNIAAIMVGRADAPVHGTTVTRVDVESIYRRLSKMSLEARREVPGLEPARADVIVAGAAILAELLAFVDAADFRVSIRGLRFGLLAQYASF